MEGTSGSRLNYVAPSLYYKPYPSPLATFFDVIWDKKLFKLALENLHRRMGSKYIHFISTKNPTVGGKELDLHLLFMLVTARGGLERVTEDRRWKEINAVFKYPSTVTNASYILRKYYESILLHFEKLYYFGEHGYHYVPGPRSSCYFGTTDFNVTGVIDAKFEAGFFATIYYSGKKMQAVLYRPPSQPAHRLTLNQPVQQLARIPPEWRPLTIREPATRPLTIVRSEKRPLTLTQPEKKSLTLPKPDWWLLTAQPERPLTIMQPERWPLTITQPGWRLLTTEPQRPLTIMQPEIRKPLTRMQPENQLTGMQPEQKLTEMQPAVQQVTGMQLEKPVTWKQPEQVSEVSTGYGHSSERQKMHVMSYSRGYKFYFRNRYAELKPLFSSGGENEINRTIAEQWSKLPEDIKDMYQEIAFTEKRSSSKADCVQCPMPIRGQVASEEDFHFKSPALPNQPPIPDYDQKQKMVVKVEPSSP